MQGWKTGVNGTQLWDMLQNSFAWVPTKGYTNKANVTTQYPVVIGDFGSSFATLSVRAASSWSHAAYRNRATGLAKTHGCVWQESLAKALDCA